MLIDGPSFFEAHLFERNRLPNYEDKFQNRQRQTVGVVDFIAQRPCVSRVLRAYQGMALMADLETIELSGQCCTPEEEVSSVGSRFDLDVSVTATMGGEAVRYAACLDVLLENTVSVAGISKDEFLPIVACERLRQALVASNCTLADVGDTDMMLLVKALEGRWLASGIATDLAEPSLKRPTLLQTTSERPS